MNNVDYRVKFKKYEELNGRVKMIRRIANIILGIFIIAFSSTLMNQIPIILGIITIVFSSIELIIQIKKKDYEKIEDIHMGNNIIFIILGIMILLNNQNAIPFIAMIWGISGLRSGIKGLNIVIYNKINEKKYVPELIHAIIETFLSVLLIFNPFEKFEEHLIILGIQLIANSLKIGVKDKEYIKAVE